MIIPSRGIYVHGKCLGKWVSRFESLELNASLIRQITGQGDWPTSAQRSGLSSLRIDRSLSSNCIKNGDCLIPVMTSKAANRRDAWRPSFKETWNSTSKSEVSKAELAIYFLFNFCTDVFHSLSKKIKKTKPWKRKVTGLKMLTKRLSSIQDIFLILKTDQENKQYFQK